MHVQLNSCSNCCIKLLCSNCCNIKRYATHLIENSVMKSVLNACKKLTKTPLQVNEDAMKTEYSICLKKYLKCK